MRSIIGSLMGLLLVVGTSAQPLVEGRVRLAAGQPVANAQVRLFDATDLRRSVRAITDETGYFALPLAALSTTALPQQFYLGQNYPNPFNPSTIIPYRLPVSTRVRLEVLNILGQRLATLVDAEQPAGFHTAAWDGTDASGRGVAAGVYLYRLVGDEVRLTRSMVLLDGAVGTASAGSVGAELGGTEPSDLARVYGLTVSGQGLIPYVDPAFRVETEAVDIVVEVLDSVPQDKEAVRRLLGDLDNSGRVDWADALLAVLYSEDPSIALPNNGDISLGDVSRDGQIDLADAQLIETYSIDPSDPSLPAGIGKSVDPPPLDDPRLTQIELPEGFHIRVYAEGVPGARSLSLSPSGTLFVGTRSGSRVYALRDEDGDHKAERVIILASGLNRPNGVAFKDGDLYVAEVSRILRYRNIEAHLDNPPQPEIVNDSFPTDRAHGWKFIRFGPDGLLYVPVGAPCNICASPDPYASIGRLDPSTGDFEVVSRGVRNSVGFDWHPETGEMWFTENGRDWMGDDLPPDELNRVTADGQHFGYPYCHGTNIADPAFGAQRDCGEFVPPVQELGPHVAALGMRFYTGNMFPAEYRNQIFIAEHGSWNRTRKIGYRLTLVRLAADGTVSYEPFAEGWLQGESNWGRPVDVLVMPDGSLLISDDQAGLIYRISH
ncbi:MAG: PQQ-dependent sugar dehydrogenase [Candidatus Latescibacteria bacterium]|nr:PQQ-dependent sugar dehydrogenase [Candidatus Latescibacterota bacterium]